MKGMNNKNYKITHLSGTTYKVDFKVDGDYFSKGSVVIDLAEMAQAQDALFKFTSVYYVDTIIDAAKAHCNEKGPGVPPKRKYGMSNW